MRDSNRFGFESGSESPSGGVAPKTNGTNGVHPEGMRTRSFPVDEIGEPIDLVAVQADDELINALAAGMTVSSPGVVGYDADDHVAAILAAWRAEVDAEPVPELVDVDTAVATIMAAARPPSRRARHLAPVAAAAAFVLLTVGGVSVGSYSSEPGDALWAVSKVLYSERAESVEAAARVETRIEKAKQALVRGQTVVAEKELREAMADLAVVRPQEGKAELAEVQDFLVAKTAETRPGTPTDPGAPLANDRARRVPRGAAVENVAPPGPATSSSSSSSADTAVPPAGTGPAPNTDPKSLGPAQQRLAPEPTVTPTTSPTTSRGIEEGGPNPGGSTTTTATSEGGPAGGPTTVPGQSRGGPPAGGGTAAAGGTTTGGSSSTAGPAS